MGPIKSAAASHWLIQFKYHEETPSRQSFYFTFIRRQAVCSPIGSTNWERGFSFWLDERELVAGDPSGKKISEALDSARVVLVVTSKASIKSNWLAFELNKATSRMIKGECRVIPVVIDKGKLPPEVGGLLYADFTSSFEFGFRAIITALENDVGILEREARQKAMRNNFWTRAELALTEIFGSVSRCSLMGEYESIDYDTVPLPIPHDNQEETDVVYETVSQYGDAKPLTDRWWSEYADAIQRIPEKLFLVVTERPIAFKTEQSHSTEPRIGVKIISGWKREPSAYVVLCAAKTDVCFGPQADIYSSRRNQVPSS